jgi:hypothetical protein
VSVSRTTSATAGRVIRWSRSGMKEMVVLTRPPVAAPSGCTVSDSSPAASILVNLQVEHGQAKRYQVRQVAGLARRYDWPLEDER